MEKESSISFPLAMAPPQHEVTIVDAELIAKVTEMSRQSPRGRIIFPFHKSNNDPLHRMLNAIQPYSYIQPHRHSNPPKAESIIMIRGTIAYLTFGEEGKILATNILSIKMNEIGVDTEPGTFHSFFALENDTILFEIKPGPYERSLDKDFAHWAPPEKSQQSAKYLRSLYEIIETEMQFDMPSKTNTADPQKR